MLSLKIMNHAFEIDCGPEDYDSLTKAAELLEEKIDEMPAMMKNERKLLLVALNICYDYLTLKEESLKSSEKIETQLTQLLLLLQNAKLDNLKIEKQDDQAEVITK